MASSIRIEYKTDANYTEDEMAEILGEVRDFIADLDGDADRNSITAVTLDGQATSDRRTDIIRDFLKNATIGAQVVISDRGDDIEFETSLENSEG